MKQIVEFSSKEQTEKLNRILSKDKDKYSLYDIFENLPFDITYKESDDFSERIARNQQLLLKEESHFDKVTDPSAGSYYIENLTRSIAEQAWKLFLDIQNNGGFFAAVESGKVQEDMKATSAKRLKDVSSRKEVLLGTNQYPNFTEKAADKITKDACGCKCADFSMFI